LTFIFGRWNGSQFASAGEQSFQFPAKHDRPQGRVSQNEKQQEPEHTRSENSKHVHRKDHDGIDNGAF
jgi:hypothetical protein